jgi:hypothetical protein
MMAACDPVRPLLVAALFLLAFLPRAIQPVSRPLVWYLRSAHFIEAVLSGDWVNTVYSEHPGVTLMWPVGIGLKLYWVLSGITPAAHTVPLDFEPIHFFGPVPRVEIAAALIPLALLIALGVVGAYLMLRRLFDDTTSAVAGLLLAFSPYYLAQSKILHLDATMATLMLLSALALLAYRRERKARWVLLSGVLGGLALLVKIPALFLLPYTGLVLLTDSVHNPQATAYNTRYVIRSLVFPLSVWCLAAVVVYFAFWPVMWVEPGRGLAAVRWGITRHAATAHDSPTLFLGRVMRDDPGPLFYVVSMLFRTGEIELAFLVVAALLGITHLLRGRPASNESGGQKTHVLIDLLLLGGYAIFYLAQMSLGAKKMPRYILPSLLMMDVLAATGVVAWARSLAGEHQRLGLALMALPVLVQAMLSLGKHPYYGTALNWLAGGPPVASRAILIGEEGEGYAELAGYLNARHDAGTLTVAAQLKHVFNQTFHGTTVEIDGGQGMASIPADYLAFHRNYTARDYKIGEWGHLWERYAPRTPEREIQFDGVSYAWLYPVLSSGVGPEHAQINRLGDRFRFLGYDLRENEAAPGDRVPVVLYWQATDPLTEDLSIFLHLVDSAGELIWQDDGAARHGDRPTWSWAPGETIVDPHTVALPSDLPEGEYALTTGLYDWQTGERLSVRQLDGTRMTEDRVSVATLAVRQPRTHAAAWLARGLALLTLLSALVSGVGWRALVGQRSYGVENDT